MGTTRIPVDQEWCFSWFSMILMIGFLQRRDAIASWMKLKMSPHVRTVETEEKAQDILSAKSTLVFGFLNSLEVIGASFLLLTFITAMSMFMLKAITELGRLHIQQITRGLYQIELSNLE